MEKSKNITSEAYRGIENSMRDAIKYVSRNVLMKLLKNKGAHHRQFEII
jgi:hypothetical protein